MKVKDICDVLDDCYITIVRSTDEDEEDIVLFDDEETTNPDLWMEFAEEKIVFITPVPAKNPEMMKLAIVVF